MACEQRLGGGGQGRGAVQVVAVVAARHQELVACGRGRQQQRVRGSLDVDARRVGSHCCKAGDAKHSCLHR